MREGKTYQESSLKRDCAAAVKICFSEHRRRCGTRRIAAELKTGRAAVRRIMQRENLRAIVPKKFTPKTTDSKHGLPIGANLLQDGERAPTGKGDVMVGDITYLRLGGGGTFCYPACLQDKFTRRIVGWKVAGRMRAQLVIDVLLQARRRGLIGKNAIIHTAQGSQHSAIFDCQIALYGQLPPINEPQGKLVTTTRKPKVSFPALRRNWLKMVSLNRLRMLARKSSVTSKDITIESGCIRV